MLGANSFARNTTGPTKKFRANGLARALRILWTPMRPRRPRREQPPLLAKRWNWGSVMHHTPYGRSVTYDPDTLKKLGETFDRAGPAIAGNFTGSSCDADAFAARDNHFRVCCGR